MKKGVKKCSNHEPVVIGLKVLNHEAGQNRHDRRTEEAQKRGSKMAAKKYMATVEAKNRRKATAERIEKQVARVKARKIERENARKAEATLAEKYGNPTKYSVA